MQIEYLHVLIYSYYIRHILEFLTERAQFSTVNITTTKTGSLDIFKLSREGSLDGCKNVVEASVKKGKVLDG